MIDAVSSSATDVRRLVTSSSGTSAPAATSEPIASFSNCHTCARSGADSRTASTIPACASVSTNTALAPESDRIHCTCSALDVS